MNGLYSMLLVFLLFTSHQVSSYTTECNPKSSLAPGDLIIAGLFDLHDSDSISCGDISATTVQEVEAILWTLKKLNEQNHESGVKIGLSIHDTCGQEDVAVRNLFRVLPEYNYTKSTNCTGSDDPLFVGVLGPTRSGPARLVSSILSKRPPAQQYFQLSYSATAADLSNKELYPNFFRVIPSDTGLVEALVKLLDHLEWNYFAVVYSNEAYGTNALLEFKKLIAGKRICIATELGLSMHEDNRDQILEFFQIISKKMKGVIYLGQHEKAAEMLEKGTIHKDRITRELTFIIAEGVNLASNSTIPSRGVISIGPTQKGLPRFQEHWNHIMTNKTALNEAAQQNPWLNELVEDPRSCSLIHPRECTNLSSVNSIFTAYAIHAIHMYAHIVRKWHASVCGSAGICRELRNQDPTGITAKAKDVTLDYNELILDNADRLIYISFGFDDNGDVEGTSRSHTYEINLIESSTSKRMIGEFAEGNLNNLAQSVYGITTSQCVESCMECIDQPVADEVIFIPGDVYIVGLAPIHDPPPGRDQLECGDVRITTGNDLAEALIYAVQTVNGSPWEFFGNRRLGLVVLNTCRSPLIMQKRILSLYTDSFAELHAGFNASSIIGIVGAATSAVTVPLAKLALEFNLTVVSYAATTPQLSDRKEFPNFLRTCPPDTKQVAAILSFLDHNNWRNISVIYLDDTYGRTGLEVLERGAPDYNICIAQSIRLKKSHMNSAEVTEKLLNQPEACVVVIITGPETARQLMEGFENSNIRPGEFIFIGSEAWGNQKSITKGMNIAVGSFTFGLPSSVDKGFQHYMKGRNPSSASNNPWFRTHWKKKFKCNIQDSFQKVQGTSAICDSEESDDSATQDVWVPFVIDSVVALSLGASTFLKTGGCNGPEPNICNKYYTEWRDVYESIKSTTINNKQIFDNNGEGTQGYDIYNIQDDPSNSNGHNYVKVAEWTQEYGIKFLDVSVKFPGEQCIAHQNSSRCLHTNVADEVTDNGWRITAIIFIVLLVLTILYIIILFTNYVRNIRHKRSNRNVATTDKEANGDADVVNGDDATDYIHYIDPTYPQSRQDSLPAPPAPRTGVRPNVFRNNSVAEDGAPSYEVSTRNSETRRKLVYQCPDMDNSKITIV